MKSARLLSTLATVALLTTSTLTARAQAQRQVGAFQKISTSGACDVVLTQGSTTEVKVQAEADTEKYIRTEVQNGTLLIYRDKDAPSQLFHNKKTVVYVTCPRLTGLQASGASDVKSESTFTADDFTIKASGASDVTLRLNAKQLTVTASGASDVRLAGRVERQQVNISGSSDYRASDLQSQQADVQASGASDAYVFVDKELSARSSGASDVHNKGRAQVTK